MRRILILIFFCGFWLTSLGQSYAQTPIPKAAKSNGATVNASVGGYYLNIEAYQSPNASVVIESISNIFLSSTTADEGGYFEFLNVLISQNFPGFCFTAIDFKRIGESESCVEINDVITGDQNYKDVFLPPTIGLSRKLIAVGEDAEIYGYSMPNAAVVINFDGESITLQADETGYYEYIFEDAPAGTYVFSADATLNEIKALEPKTKAVLEVVSLPEQVRDNITGFAEDLEEKFPGILFLLPLLLILIALLIALIWKTKPRFIFIIFDKFKKRYPMHHDYFLFK